MLHRIITAAITLVFFGSSGALAQGHEMKAATKADVVQADSVIYVCPMHPKVTSSNPGKCPECGMDLVKQKHAGSKDVTAPSDSPVYACPMHPKETSSKPGTCSKCGMDLVKQKPKGRSKGMSASKQAPSKDDLIAAGTYNCCTKKPCDECYKEHQSCNCYRNAKTTRRVCGECGEGWKKGEGRVPGVHPDSIRSESHSH